MGREDVPTVLVAMDPDRLGPANFGRGSGVFVCEGMDDSGERAGNDEGIGGDCGGEGIRTGMEAIFPEGTAVGLEGTISLYKGGGNGCSLSETFRSICSVFASSSSAANLRA